MNLLMDFVHLYCLTCIFGNDNKTMPTNLYLYTHLGLQSTSLVNKMATNLQTAVNPDLCQQGKQLNPGQATINFKTLKPCFVTPPFQSYLPHPLEMGKTTASILKLASKITGCIIWSSHYPQNRKIQCFVNHDQGGGYPNLSDRF